MQPPTLWLIGDFTTAEFAFAAEGIRSDVPRRQFASIQRALDFLATAGEAPAKRPEVIVLAQSRPGEIPAALVERLHAACPLSRLIVLLGAWCEGEMRTGYPIAGTARIFWHAFPSRLNRLLADFRGGRSAPWAFPRIAGQQERLLREIPAAQPDPAPLLGGTLLIRAVNYTAFEILAESFLRQGHHCLWLDVSQLARYRSCDSIVWDAPQLDPPEWHLLSACRAAMPTAGLILLAGFPRQDDLAQAQALGVKALLAKPYLVADLAEAVAAAVMRVPASLPRQQCAG